MRMDLGMRSTSHYDSMPCMTVASLEMSDETKNSRRVEKNSRRLVKRKYPLCMPWWKRPAKLTGKNHERFMWRVLRARVYTHLISRNKHSPLHTVLVSYWFSKVLSVKALKSKPSHTAKRLWRVGESKSSHRKNVGNQEKNGIKHCLVLK